MEKEIIQVTYEVFAEKGYSASLSEIFGKLGLKKSSLYNYFDNKEDLFFKMIETKLRELYQGDTIHLSSNKNVDTIDQLEGIFRCYIETFQDVEKLKFLKRLSLIQKPSLLKKTNEVIKNKEYSFRKKLEEILSSVINTQSGLEKYKETITLTYISLIHGVLDAYLIYGDEENFNKYVKDVWSFFVKGLEYYLSEDN